MIADYLFNTPTPAGSQCVLVLLKQPYADSGALTSDLIGKSVADVGAQANVLGVSAPTPAGVFGFRNIRKSTGVFAGRRAAPNFEIPAAATFDVVRDGYAGALAICLVVNSTVSRAVSMLLQRDGIEALATRLAFSVDDDFISAVEGPAFMGQPIGDVLATVVHDPMAMVPSLIGAPLTASLVHEAMSASGVPTPPAVVEPVDHLSMQMVPNQNPSTIDKATIQTAFRAATAGEYTLSSDERTLTKIGVTDDTARSFEVTGKPRPNAKCFMRVRFNGSPYPVIIVSNGIVKPNNQVAWTIGSLAANVWHEVRVEHVSGDTYKYTVGSTVLYTGTATNLSFYGHTNVMVTEVDTGQLGTTLPAGFVWL